MKASPNALRGERREVAVEEGCRTAAGARPRRGAGTRAMPTSIAPDGAEPGDPVEAPLGSRRERPRARRAAGSRARRRPARARGSRASGRRARSSSGPEAPNASVAGGALLADAEREDTRDGVAVGRGDAPAHRVPAAPEPSDRYGHDAAGRPRLRAGPETIRPAGGQYGDRVRQRLHTLVEAKPNDAGRTRRARCRSRASLLTSVACAQAATAGNASAKPSKQQTVTCRRLTGAALPRAVRGGRRPAPRRGRQ